MVLIRALTALTLSVWLVTSAGLVRAGSRESGRPAVENGLAPVSATSLDRPTRSPRPLSLAGRTADVKSTALELPASAFSPATVERQNAGTITSSIADQLDFHSFHNSSYETLGLQGGFYQPADWQPPGAGSVTFEYQGGIFTSSAAAAAALQDAVSHLAAQGTTATTCSSSVQTTCDLFGYQTENGGTGRYIAAQYNQCLVETLAAAPPVTFQANSNQINTTLATITLDAVNLAKTACTTTPPPTPIAFSMLTVRVETPGDKFDWNLVRPPLQQVSAGQKLRLTIYWRVTSAPAHHKYVATYIVRRRGAIVIHQKFTERLSANPDQTWGSWATYRLKTPGNYIFEGRISMHGTTLKARIGFAVVRRVTNKVSSGSFSFSQFRILNNQGKAERRFRPGQPFVVKLAWVAHGIKNVTSAYIALVFVDPRTGRALYPPLHKFASTRAGINFDGETLHALTHNFRLAAGITVGKTTRRKSVLLQVSG